MDRLPQVGSFSEQVWADSDERHQPLGYVEVEHVFGVAVGAQTADGVALLAAIADVNLGGDVTGVRGVAAVMARIDRNDLSRQRFGPRCRPDGGGRYRCS